MPNEAKKDHKFDRERKKKEIKAYKRKAKQSRLSASISKAKSEVSLREDFFGREKVADPENFIYFF